MGEYSKINPGPLIEWLNGVCPRLLGATSDEFAKHFANLEQMNKIRAYVGDEQTSGLFISREVLEKEEADKPAGGKKEEGKGEKEETEYQITVEQEVSFKGKNANTIALLKRNHAAFRAAYDGTTAEGDGGKSAGAASGAPGNFGPHLQLITMGVMDAECTPFDLSVCYVQNAFQPLFNAYSKSSDGHGGHVDDHEEGKVGIPNVQRKLADLNMALLQCQQNVEIENIHLPIDHVIAEAFEQASKEGRDPPTEADFQERVKDDTAFCNQLQSTVSKWSKEIQRVAKRGEQVERTTGTTMQEINFWLGMEKALEAVQEQLHTPEIALTLNLLRGARRFMATMSFETDTGLKPAMEKVSNYLILLREFPINDLLVATSIEQVTQAVRVIFNHMRKIKNANQYPLCRAYNLVEAVSRDLKTQILKILSKEGLMQQESEAFDSNMAGCNDLFRVWDDEVRQFKELVREQLKKRGNNERPPLKINCEHTHLQDRIIDLQKFRKQHMKLQEVIERVLADGKESGAKAEVLAAYQLIEKVDVLDVSGLGQRRWEDTKKEYDKKIDHAESEITARLRDRLGAAKTATEMFRVFSRFNALFVRPRIRGAIQEYQSSLIQQVKDDVRRLQDKFKDNYETTQACKMAKVRDIPPTAARVIWAKQLERRLQVYMGRVEDVLGRGWEQHVDGQKLKQEGDAFAKKMRTVAIFDQWLKDTKDSKSFDVSMRIFDIQQSYSANVLLVNFDEQIITLFKEVRNLQALQFRVPYAVKVTSDEAKQNYPFAMTLQEATRTYMQTCAQITGTLQPMMASYQHNVQQMIQNGLQMKWESERVDQYTRNLSEQVFQFQQKFTELESITEQMNSLVAGIDDIDVRQNEEAPRVLNDLFEKMQKMIDDMNLANFSNLELWVSGINKDIEVRLLRALNKLVTEWLRQFTKWPANGLSLVKEGGVHELRIENHLLIVDPQKEYAMTKWVCHFHDCLGMVCNLPVLQAARFDAFQKGGKGKEETTHRSLIAQLDPKVLQDAYDTIAKMVKQVEEYVNSWLQYQALWEINTSTVLGRLGDDLEKWHNLLTEIKQFSVRFDSSEQEKSFGPIVVEYKKVQTKVKSKYDQWHLDLLSEFGEKVKESMSKFFRQVNKGRQELEQADSGSGGDLTKMCMAVLNVKAKKEEWSKKYEELGKAQKLLDRQRYGFPDDWMPLEQCEGEWNVFEQILDRRDRVLDSELPKLKQMLMQREKQMDETITMLYAEWSAQKPVQGSCKPSDAKEIIKMFEDRLVKLTEEYNQVITVKKSLQMEVGNTEALAPLQEEMWNLKGVWSEIDTVYSKVESLKETLWTAVVPKKIRATLEETLAALKNMPPKLRQYEAFDHISSQLQGYIKLNMLVADLKTDALKERHWKMINQALKLTVGFNELTLGHLWEANLEKNQPQIKDILNRAQGEMGLEEFMNEIREKWSSYDLELVSYKAKCRLIRGWDELFEALDEHIQNVQSMKMSPFYKSFEEEGSMWDDRLNKIRLVFDAWMDVQRRWVYLEGIFCSSADIQQLLPNEFSRFKTIDTEFIGLMKKVAAKPKVLEASSIEGVAKHLERLGDMLTAVQKALGDYLEKQRSQFARFYFVGDEDLLEMIGNSRDVGTVSRHLGKMFAGIATLITDENNEDVLKAMYSREGETVEFIKPIKISEEPAINAWLGKVEANMQGSLGEHLNNAMLGMESVFTDTGAVSEQRFMEWVTKYPCQIMLMAILADWCQKVEVALTAGGGDELQKIIPRCVEQLTFMAGKVITDIGKDVRQKLAQMITEVVHQRDVTRTLHKDGINHAKDFQWLQLMRMYFNPKEDNLLQRLTICMADAQFYYGFEYLGIADKLVQTPLTDRCFLTLTQALHMRLGANPFGPAGTGKTESVKALGATMGRFVLVFCCDEGFDFQAMGRIFVGLCQVGAWGCFDEFNRLEERILSAVSEQVLTIQTGNKQNKKEIEILGKPVRLNSNVGIFVTMNPGYAGRSNLPDNLKQLFRAMAMTTPDKALIAQVNLFNQGFGSAERLAGKVVFLFDLCKDQLSSQPHYDFGLRSLKAVLACAGTMKREVVTEIGLDKLKAMPEEELTTQEQNILLRAIYDTLVPKLVASDKPLMTSLITGVFPDAEVGTVKIEVLQNEIRRLCELRHFECSDNFMLKCMELYQIQRITHGVMLVGTVGTGKSTVWRTLLDAMEKVDNVKGDAYVVDPKAVSKEELYGKLDATTLEWTDGVFTDILRRVTYGLRGEKDRRQWIMFDGDVDPEWAENLNSVLDDNKMLTLPNGERLAIPPNVRIMFEVDTLKYATLATVSRCGMVWFANDVVLADMMCKNELKTIKFGNLESKGKKGHQGGVSGEEGGGKIQETKAKCADILLPYFEEGNLALRALNLAESSEHIMVFTAIRALTSLFSLLRKGINMIIEYDEHHEDFPLADDIITKFISKYLVFAICWAFGGDMHLNLRMTYCEQVAGFLGDIDAPDSLGGDTTLLDFEVRIEDGRWYHWNERVPVLDIEPEKVGDSSLIISTVDTVRHTAALAAWLEERRPFILSGPPGSGKTMTLMSTMKSMAGSLELASLNFSAGTTPDLILKTFELYCETVKTPSGFVLRPLQLGKWVVVFCDECNLPEEDKYGTQKVIMFIRQITEAGGFYRPSDRQWVTVERVQFLGACNPPTDPGRHPMSDRFLRHSPVIWVDYPGPDSLRQIYGTFNKGMLKLQPTIDKSCGDKMTWVMTEFWRENSKKFTSDMQPHYLYSPRELTRWKTSLYETMKKVEGMTETQLIRLVIHEALRIFVDRLVHEEETEWANETIDNLAREHFQCDDETIKRPILFSTYLDSEGRYVGVEREDLREFVRGKLSQFYEEELAVHLVIFDEVLDHIVRMDRVLRQPLGHLLLVGASGAGKTVLSKFISWMNGLTVYMLKVGRNYDVFAFENDLRIVMKRSAIKKEKITFIFDESNALGPAFLERMNALLAAGEVPGLFEGDEYTTLMNECKGAGFKGVDDSEIFANFTKQVQRNLHIVFTMNPANPDFYNRSNSSPALFNRCIIDWFGDWPEHALEQVAADFIKDVEMSQDAFAKSSGFEDDGHRHEVLTSTIVKFHQRVDDFNVQLRKSAQKYNFITPRDFLDFINHFLDILKEKREEVLEQQRHIDGGLTKLRETEEQVNNLQAGLAIKETELTKKNKEAEETMTQMVKGQGEAEEKKTAAQKLSVELEAQTKVIDEKSAVIKKEIEEVEPALEAAKNAVQGVTKSALDELRQLGKPPDGVRIAMTAATIMVKPEAGTNVTWDQVKKLMKDPEYIPSILKFDANAMKPATRNVINKDYLGNKSWDIEKIGRASKMAGPVAQWVESQMKFAHLLTQLDPMRRELDDMEAKKQVNVEGLQAQQDAIKQMENKIIQFKEEYAKLISAVEQIKAEMLSVKKNCTRANQLVGDLSGEKVRWEASSSGFQEQLNTAIGDVLISGAFCTFIGFFDLFMRANVMKGWKDELEENDIKSKDNLEVINYLCKPSERLAWKENALPDDDLCYENAIIMKRFIRYPFVIDPSGQAVTFLQNEFKHKKLMKTSFVDSTFMKQLETSLRFGAPILIMDVDKVDPILNNVLNKETFKQGPRILISLGDQDIDFSPTFEMYMCTRDSTAQFTPDLCSRVTFVNFTVTQSSLESQCMNALLKSERADVDEKRANLLKLQGEFKVKIRELEDSLLHALSNVQGSILEDEKVISTLERIKRESAEIQEQVAKTDAVMHEIEDSINFYEPAGSMAASLFFLLESMGSLNPLYRFSLAFFLDLFNMSIKTPTLKDEKDYKVRNELIVKAMFDNAFNKVVLGLQETDILVYALRLAQVMAEQDDPMNKDQLDLLLKGASTDVTKGANAALAEECTQTLTSKLNQQQVRGFQDLHSLTCFAGLVGCVRGNESEWEKWLDLLEPEKAIPEGWRQDSPSKVNSVLQDALVCKAFRPDRLVSVCTTLVDTILGKGFVELPDFNLAEIVEKDTKASSPIMMVSAPGFDPSGKVNELANTQKKKLDSIAMGSAEGFSVADKAIIASSKNGTWVLLKNVHLAIKWLGELEKKIYSMNPQQNFRLFLTLEFNPRIPANLTRLSRVYVFEPPSGVKASIQRSFVQTLPAEKTDRDPTERCRLHFLLAFLHAVVLDRLRYYPVGWSKKYEFSDADQACGRDIIDAWVDSATNNGKLSNISPDKIPWDAIRAILCDSIYGGRIDNEFDQAVLNSVVNYLFTEESFNSEFCLNMTLNPEHKLAGPDGRKREQFLAWIEALPAKGSPTWIGLPVHAEQMLRITRANYTLAKWLSLQGSASQKQKMDKGGGPKKRASIKNPLASLGQRVNQMLENLPDSLDMMTRSEKSLQDPLWRCFDREMGLGKSLLSKIRADLTRLKGACEGQVKTTNDIRQLIADFNADAVPKGWKKYAVADISATEWLSDFNKRMEQLSNLGSCDSFQRFKLWYGGLFFPEAFLTASRQAIAQRKKCSLEELLAIVDIGNTTEEDDAFHLKGMQMEGAAWDSSGGGKLTQTDDLSVELAETRLRWVHRESAEYKATLDFLRVPVYLNTQRNALITAFSLQGPKEVPNTVWQQRAVCTTLWTKQ